MQSEGQQDPVVPAHRLHPPLRQAPHGEIEEPLTPGLHAEDRALVEHEGVLTQDGQEVVGIVASDVTDEGIEGAEARGIQGHREDECRTVPRDPLELAEGLAVVLDVLDDVEGTYQVEAAIGEWQGGDLGERRETRAGPETREGRLADVDEVRARDGKPRMQTRADLEPRRRRCRERGEQRPGVESLRRDEVARRPERVVKATVGCNVRARRVRRSSCRHGGHSPIICNKGV